MIGEGIWGVGMGGGGGERERRERGRMYVWWEEFFGVFGFDWLFLFSEVVRFWSRFGRRLLGLGIVVVMRYGCLLF